MKKRFSLISLLLALILLISTSSGLCAQSFMESKNHKMWFVENGSYFGTETDLNLKPNYPAKAQDVEELPTQYDLRNVDGKNYVTPVQFQNPWNNCWVFGSLSAVESNLLLNGAPQNTKLSERALCYYTSQLQGGQNEAQEDYEGVYFTSDYPELTPKISLNCGGNTLGAVGQMSSWNGASTAAEIPYQNDQGYQEESVLPGIMQYTQKGTWGLPYADIYDNAYHLQNSIELSTYSDFSPENIADYTTQAKQMLMDHGALMLTFGIYQDTNYFNVDTWSQYAAEPLEPDHGVAIVGWDDDYAVENFNSENLPPGPGAWICKNNWSTGWGYEGYFYLSYYDQTIGQFAAFDAELPQNYSYDNNLEYDYLGVKGAVSNTAGALLTSSALESGINAQNIKFANIFTSEEPQVLKAVSATTTLPASAEVINNIYLLEDGYQNPEDGTLVATQTNIINTTGLNTIPLESPVNLAEGQTFSVVQQVIYKDLDFGETIGDAPGIQLEMGIDRSLTIDMSIEDQSFTANRNILAKAEPGESFVYGLNSEILETGQGTPSWEDVTSPDIQKNLSVSVQQALQSPNEVNSVPGNCLIKAYTVDGVAATDITINEDIETVYLATSAAGSGAKTSQELTATLSPSGATDPITWSINTGSVASLSATSGNTITVTALNEGKTYLTINAGAATKIVQVIVSNQPIVTSDIIVNTSSPDYFTVTVNDVQSNPALPVPSQPINHVSIFAWSEAHQQDINAKWATQIPGTNNWVFENFPVNDNEYHNFFNDASRIWIHVYASLSVDSEGTYLGGNKYDWVNADNCDSSLAYIGYSQNIGFDKPTVFNSQTAGNPSGSFNLEGLRISSNVTGVDVNTQVHVQNIGWLDPTFTDGQYAGTMHENKGIEAVILTLSGVNAPNYQIQYRVYQLGVGWTDWASSGQVAGSTGANKQITAIEVNLIQNYEQ